MTDKLHRDLDRYLFYALEHRWFNEFPNVRQLVFVRLLRHCEAYLFSSKSLPSGAGLNENRSAALACELCVRH